MDTGNCDTYLENIKYQDEHVVKAYSLNIVHASTAHMLVFHCNLNVFHGDDRPHVAMSSNLYLRRELLTSTRTHQIFSDAPKLLPCPCLTPVLMC